MHPLIAYDIARQRHAELIAEADRHRVIVHSRSRTADRRRTHERRRCGPASEGRCET